MDKLITGIIIVAVVGFFYWLYTTGGDMGAAQMDASWVAVVGMGEHAHEAGRYGSYMECYQAVGNKVDVTVTPYSCSHQ